MCMLYRVPLSAGCTMRDNTPPQGLYKSALLALFLLTFRIYQLGLAAVRLLSCLAVQWYVLDDMPTLTMAGGRSSRTCYSSRPSCSSWSPTRDALGIQSPQALFAHAFSTSISRSEHLVLV